MDTELIFERRRTTCFLGVLSLHSIILWLFALTADWVSLAAIYCVPVTLVNSAFHKSSFIRWLGFATMLPAIVALVVRQFER